MPSIKKESKLGKKRGREERLDKIMGGIVDKILTSQAESDRKFLELEEKRLRLEEREKEREEKMRREEREFQLKLMSMLVQAPIPSSYQPQYMQTPSVYPSANYSTNSCIDEF